jgi:predicted glycoside hydrolase/deacetylase ChbG (UPF0249 family)
MPDSRRLIVNADDFGRSAAINRGIIATLEQGIVTSTSLMVRWPSSADAAAYARSRRDVGVGLHIDLGEWICRGGEWEPSYRVVAGTDPRAVSEEVERQLRSFQDLLGRNPTHLDSHQHAHRDEPARTIVIEMGRRLGVPVRHFSPAVRYCGAFYGQTDDGQPIPDAVSVDALVRILTRLPPGTTELCCHPGAGDLETTYGSERDWESTTLRDPRVREAVLTEGIRLCSFADALMPKEDDAATTRV